MEVWSAKRDPFRKRVSPGKWGKTNRNCSTDVENTGFPVGREAPLALREFLGGAVTWAFGGCSLHHSCPRRAPTGGLAFNGGNFACLQQLLQTSQVFAQLDLWFFAEHLGEQCPESSGWRVVFNSNVDHRRCPSMGGLEFDGATIWYDGSL